MIFSCLSSRMSTRDHCATLAGNVYGKIVEHNNKTDSPLNTFIGIIAAIVTHVVGTHYIDILSADDTFFDN